MNTVQSVDQCCTIYYNIRLIKSRLSLVGRLRQNIVEKPSIISLGPRLNRWIENKIGHTSYIWHYNNNTKGPFINIVIHKHVFFIMRFYIIILIYTF